MMTRSLQADEIAAALELEPHPEGGYFRETYRHVPESGGRGHKTSIYYLLPAGEVSHWHRVDAVEIWHFHGGAPLELSVSIDGATIEIHRLGLDFEAGARPQVTIPAGAWQSARSLGDWTLIGCTVAPAFEFENFELAPPGWRPGDR